MAGFGAGSEEPEKCWLRHGKPWEPRQNAVFGNRREPWQAVVTVYQRTPRQNPGAASTVCEPVASVYTEHRQSANDALHSERTTMSTKLTCTAQHPETGICTFVYVNGTRILNFTASFAEIDTWCKNAVTMMEMCDAPFPTGPGIFDHPVISFALYSLVMQLGGNEELVGAELSMTANQKVSA